jgi:alanyl-tRNA synthetase
MEEQRKLSGKKMKSSTKEVELPEAIQPNFVGYQETAVVSPVLALIVDDALVEIVDEGQECWVVTQQCPFFPTMGGQVDDQGWIKAKGNQEAIRELKKMANGVVAYKIIAPADIVVGDVLEQQVDEPLRKMTMNNHTATHLLQAALIELLGKQVKQSGSVVDPNYLRFDFTYHKNLTPDEMTWVENRVNDKIRENIAVDIFETTYKQALEKGVIAIFGEKYNPEKVRVVDVPGFSAELCGGTHVAATGAIGCFKITEVGALSAGNRRIFALTGPKALELMQDNFNAIKILSQEFKVKPEEVCDTVVKQTEQLHAMQLQVRTLKKQLLQTQIPLWLSGLQEINGVPYLYIHHDECVVDELRELVEQLQKKKAGLYVAVSNHDDKSVFFVSVAPEYQQIIDLAVLSEWLQKSHGLRGGGKKGTLQGGGPKVAKNLGELIKAGLQK